jgi:hypothetical protein
VTERRARGVGGSGTGDQLAFSDDAAGAAHVQSGHFRKAQQTLPPHLARTPQIVNLTVPQDDWSALGEMAVPE